MSHNDKKYDTLTSIRVTINGDVYVWVAVVVVVVDIIVSLCT